jgi:hypothetical protein
MTPSGLELIYDYFEDHVRCAAIVRERRPIALGALGFLVGGLSVFVAQALVQRLHLFSFSWTSLAVALAWKLVAGFILVAVLHMALELQGLRGDAVALFICFGLADLAWTLAVPLMLLLKAFTRSSLLVTAAFMAVGFLTLSLKARSLQDAYRITTGKAWFTLSLPYLAIVAGLLLAVSLLVLRLVMAAMKLVG